VNDRTEASVDDWTEEPIDNQGNQGIAIERKSRSAIKGELEGSRDSSATTDRTDVSVGVCCYKVEREKLGGHRAFDGDRSRRFDGG
jgi:hypothetical protein